VWSTTCCSALAGGRVSPSPSSDEVNFVAGQDQAVRRIVGTSGARPLGSPDADRHSAYGQAPAYGLDSADPRPGAVEVPAFRVVVATDFAAESLSARTAPLSVLKAFALMFSAGQPVNLIFAVDHEAAEADALAAQQLLAQLPGDRPLAGIAIESFDEAPAQPTYVSLIPQGDPAALITDLAKTLTAMHLLAETLAHPGRLRIALVHQHLIARVRDRRLADRLTSYREVDLPGL